MADNKNLQLLEFFNDVAELDDNSFKKKLFMGLAKLSDEDWNCLEKIFCETVK